MKVGIDAAFSERFGVGSYMGKLSSVSEENSRDLSHIVMISSSKHLPTLLFYCLVSDLFPILFLLFRENCMTSGSQIHELLPSSGKITEKLWNRGRGRMNGASSWSDQKKPVTWVKTWAWLRQIVGTQGSNLINIASTTNTLLLKNWSG